MVGWVSKAGKLLWELQRVQWVRSWDKSFHKRKKVQRKKRLSNAQTLPGHIVPTAYSSQRQRIIYRSYLPRYQNIAPCRISTTHSDDQSYTGFSPSFPEYTELSLCTVKSPGHRLGSCFQDSLSKSYVIEAQDNLLQAFLHLVDSNQIIQRLGKNLQILSELIT